MGPFRDWLCLRRRTRCIGFFKLRWSLSSWGHIDALVISVGVTVLAPIVSFGVCAIRLWFHWTACHGLGGPHSREVGGWAKERMIISLITY